jgi:hypothetical protein
VTRRSTPGRRRAGAARRAYVAGRRRAVRTRVGDLHPQPVAGGLIERPRADARQLLASQSDALARGVAISGFADFCSAGRIQEPRGRLESAEPRPTRWRSSARRDLCFPDRYRRVRALPRITELGQRPRGLDQGHQSRAHERLTLGAKRWESVPTTRAPTRSLGRGAEPRPLRARADLRVAAPPPGDRESWARESIDRSGSARTSVRRATVGAHARDECSGSRRSRPRDRGSSPPRAQTTS